MTTAVFTVFLALLALSVPVAVAIGLASMAGVAFFSNMPMLVTAQQLFVTIDKFPLVAIPFFILAGNLMEAGGISERLVNFARALVGGVQGGLAMSCVITCMIFAAVSGSSVATTFAIGAILIPAMVKVGYPVQRAAALQATSAELGVIIPPSIPMILYGVAAEVSIGEMFIAGFGPGLLIGGALILFVFVWCKLTGHGKRDGEGRLELGVALRQAVLALLMPVIVSVIVLPSWSVPYTVKTTAAMLPVLNMPSWCAKLDTHCPPEASAPLISKSAAPAVVCAAAIPSASSAGSVIEIVFARIVIIVSCPTSRCLKLHLSLIRYNICNVQYMLELFFFDFVFHADRVKCLILDHICFLILDIIDVYLSTT
jgi:TRAP-type C4-dicarboxylate transport system permease large subunit